MSLRSEWPVGTRVVSREKRRKGVITHIGWVSDIYNASSSRVFGVVLDIENESSRTLPWKYFNQVWEKDTEQP